MNSYVILASLVGIPLLLAIVFRVSAIALFVGFAAGALLAQYVADDTTIVFDAFFTHTNIDAYVKLGLLVVPVVLTLLFLRKSMSTSQFVFHLIPLAVTSAALGALVLAALPGGIHHTLVNNQVGKTANSSLNALVAASSILTLLLAWLTMGHKGKSKKH